MPTLNVSPLRPGAGFTDGDGKLTKEGYDFLFAIYLRLGGSLDSLNAVTLDAASWDAPNPIGTTTPSSGKFTTLQATGAFGCNGKPVQTAAVSGGLVATTGATNVSPYGYTTAAQANEIITKLNIIITALTNCGILQP